MKKGIHPKLYDITIKCVCGADFQTVSTRADVAVDVCSNCHPFYTGKHRLVDSEGRVSRFQKKYQRYQKTKKKES